VDHLGATAPNGPVLQSLLLEVVLTFFLMFVITAMSTDIRAIGSAIVTGGAPDQWTYVAGPILGAAAGALVCQLLRGPGVAEPDTWGRASGPAEITRESPVIAGR
jgi:glycerol uptake facilitator-like aquaporin